MNWPLVLIAALTIPAAPPDSLQAPARPNEAKSGAKFGAIVGGIAGAGLFMLAGAYGEGMCESNCTDIKLGGYIGLGLAGGLLGAGAGALLGAFFGSVMPAGEVPDEKAPDEKAATSEPDPPGIAGRHDSSVPASKPPPAGQPILGSMTVFGGWSTLNSDDIDSDGWCGGARLLSHRGDWLQIGAEAGIFNVNGGMYELVGALKPTVTVGSFSPHGIFDIGWHNWTEGPSVLGAGAGGGIEWSPVPGGPAWGLESRYHWTLQNEDEPGNMSFAHVAVTARFNW